MLIQVKSMSENVEEISVEGNLFTSTHVSSSAENKSWFKNSSKTDCLICTTVYAVHFR